MEHATTHAAHTATARVHPLLLGAAASVILVSLLGAASISGMLPSSRASTTPAVNSTPSTAALAAPVSTLALASPQSAAPLRYMTADGQLLQAVPVGQTLVPVQRSSTRRVVHSYEAEPVVRHRAHHHTHANYRPVSHSYQQARYEPHPIRSYVSDMHPVGTGVGAVVGGLLGHQIGGGNGKKIATVAGVLLGGYAGNEIAHNRSPLPGQ